MAIYELTDEPTGMTVEIEGPDELQESDAKRAIAMGRKSAAEELSSGKYKIDPETRQELDKRGQRERIQKLTAYSIGMKPEDVDIDSGASWKERAFLSALPDDQSRVEFLEKRYGADNVEMLDVGGKLKTFYRDPKTNKMKMVDEQGASLADFTADIAGAVAPTVGAVGGAIAGTALTPFTGGVINPVVGAVGGAALGGFLTGVTQDVAAEVATGQDIELGKKLKQRGKEMLAGGLIDLALVGTGKFVAKPLLSKITGDSTSQVFQRAEQIVGEGSLTPRMLQGEKALTREIGLEKSLGGRIGEARSALNESAKRIVSQSDPVAYDRFAQRIADERETLLQAIPANEKDILEQVNRYYNEALQGFGAGSGKTISAIGDEVMERSMLPAVKESRRIKNSLYTEFDAIDSQVGGVFTPKQIVGRFDKVLENNRMKNASGIKSIRKEIAEQDEPFTIGEIDDLIARVTDAMPDGVVKDKTAQQLAAELSDSLTSLVQNKAKQFPALNDAWSRANQYYKNTFLRFNRGGVGGAVKEVSGDTVLSGQGFINSVLSDPREIQNVLSAAREGGQSPSVVRGYLKEAFLEKKGIRAGSSVRSLAISPEDRGIIRELWGKRGLERLDKISKGLKATPEDLNEYLGALTDNRAREIRNRLVKQSKDIERLDSIKKNKFMNSLSEGNLPAGQDEDIAKAYLSMPLKGRKELFKNMGVEAKEELRGVVGSQVMFDRVDLSPFKDAMGNNLFNGTDALRKLDKDRLPLIQLLGKSEYEDLRTLAKAQNALKPLTKDQAQAKLRTLAGQGGLSFYIVGDIISAMRDKFISLAYRTKALDPLMNGWSKLDAKAMNKALQRMLYGAQAKRALMEIDDPELESQVELLRAGIPEQN